MNGTTCAKVLEASEAKKDCYAGKIKDKRKKIKESLLIH